MVLRSRRFQAASSKGVSCRLFRSISSAVCFTTTASQAAHPLVIGLIDADKPLPAQVILQQIYIV